MHKHDDIVHIKWWHPGAHLATTSQQQSAAVEALWSSVAQRGFESVEQSLRDVHAMQVCAQLVVFQQPQCVHIPQHTLPSKFRL